MDRKPITAFCGNSECEVAEVADYYDVLGVSRDASEEEIRHAYRSQLLKHIQGSDPEDFMLLCRAYETLIIPSTRKEYDEQHAVPDELSMLLKSAQEALDNGEYAQAISYARKALMTAPGLPVARYLLAQAYLQSRQAAAAQQELERLVAEEAGNSEYLYSLAIALIAQDKYYDAEDRLREAFGLDGGNTQILSQLVTVLMHNREYDDALDFLDKASSVAGSAGRSDYTPLLKRAEVYLAMNDHSGVVKTLAEMRAKNMVPRDVGSKLAHEMQRIGKDLLEYGSNELALRFLETAAHFDGESSPIRELHKKAVRLRLHEQGSFRRDYAEKYEVVKRLEEYLAEKNSEAILSVLSEIKSKAPTNPESGIRLAHQLQAVGGRLMDEGSYKLAAEVLAVAQLLDDADRQIRYMYLRAVDLSKEPQIQARPSYSPPRRRRKLAGGWIVAMVLVAFFVVYYLSQNKAAVAPKQSPIAPVSPATPRQITRYEDGTILLNSLVEGGHQWVIENGLDRDAVVLLTTTAEPRQTLLSIYIWANSSHRFSGIPDGMYAIYFTTGHDFDEISRSFTRNVRLGRFDKAVTFQASDNRYVIYTMTLHGVAGGNASTSNVPSGVFPRID